MRILVSACLMGMHCRYDGGGVAHEELLKLAKEHELIPFCPEIYGGLPTPRTPAERVGALVMTKTGVDVTENYQRGAREALALAQRLGCTRAILKERSPSCGSGMIYDGTFSGKLVPGEGVTAALLKAEGIRVFGESAIAEAAK